MKYLPPTANGVSIETDSVPLPRASIVIGVYARAEPTIPSSRVQEPRWTYHARVVPGWSPDSVTRTFRPSTVATPVGARVPIRPVSSAVSAYALLGAGWPVRAGAAAVPGVAAPAEWLPVCCAMAPELTHSDAVSEKPKRRVIRIGRPSKGGGPAAPGAREAAAVAL